MLETVETTQVSAQGFFTLGRVGRRWIFLTPERKPFFSLELNHIDSSPLRYLENLPRWEHKYGNDSLRWLAESVAPNLKQWGFNSVGWVQKISIHQRAHTPSFTSEEYCGLQLPTATCYL